MLDGTDDWVLWILVSSLLKHFRGRGIHFSQFHKASVLEWPRKSRSTSGFAGARGYWWLSLMDFRNFSITYVFGVEKSISCSFTKLLCLSDLKNSGQFPVSQVPEGTDDWVLWIFVISPSPTCLESRNPFPAVSQSNCVWVTSKIQVNFRFCKCLWVLMIESYVFL